MQHIKTSISLPSPALADFFSNYSALRRNLPQLLKTMHRQQPTRNRLRQYNRQHGETERVNVYWTMDEYNALHGVAAAIRVSVSFLVYQMLQLLLQGKTFEPVFSNYSFRIKAWTASRMHTEEAITFSTVFSPSHAKPHPRTKPRRFQSR